MHPITLANLPECSHCLRDQFAYSPEDLALLVGMWREIVQDGAVNTIVIEDIDRPTGQRVIYFSLDGFATPEYCQYLKGKSPPIVGKQLAKLWRSGSLPLLNYS